MVKCREKYQENKYSFSDELCKFMDKYPAFYKSLKLSNDKRFIFIPIIALSHLPNSEGDLSQDEIIGMFYYDIKEDCFKQDYVVNIKRKHKQFVSYTRGEGAKDNYICSIHEFYKKYGKKGKYYYKEGTFIYEHRYDAVENLPNFRGLKSKARKIRKFNKHPLLRRLRGKRRKPSQLI